MAFYIQEDPPYSIKVINSGKKHRRTTQEQSCFDYAMGLQRSHKLLFHDYHFAVF